MKITNPKLEVVRFNADDVIATSLYYMKTADYNALFNKNLTSDYVEFEGTMVPTGESGVWGITNIYNVKEADGEDMEGLMSGGSVVFGGVTIPSTFMESTAKIAYNAFKRDDGIYTKGVTYYEQYWNQ
ncbi:MAG: hypothetical protein IJQ07_05925 [Clostridia bacterium]|nr:hypothetical protein [Clostridia bacterium]